MKYTRSVTNYLIVVTALLLVYLPGSVQGAHHGMMANPHMARLGVLISAVPFPELESLKLEYGVRVGRIIPGSPAAAAGLQVGDVIFEIDGHPIYSVKRLQWIVHKANAGSKLSIKYSRDAASNTAEAKLPDPSANQAAQAHPSPAKTVLGVAMQPMNAGLREYFGAPADAGVLVVDVTQGSAAETAGITVGDVILKLEQTPIGSAADVYRVLNALEPGTEITVEILRKNASQSVKVSPKANPMQWRHGHHSNG